MRRFLPGAAALLLACIAVTDARAVEMDPKCKLDAGTPEQRIEACTRFIGQTKPAFMTIPYIADALETRGIARAARGDCQGGLIDENAAINMTASYTSPSVQRMRYAMFISAAFIQLHCSGDFDGALDVLGRATKFKPTESTAFSGRALAFSEKDDYKSAFAEVAKALALANDNTTRGLAFAVRATIFERQGRLDEALSAFDESIRADPGRSLSYSDRGNIWRLKGDLTRALADLNIAVRINPQNAQILARRGEVLRYRGELAAAMADFDKALVSSPYSSSALTGRGLIYERQGDRTQARANFEAAVGSPLGNAFRLREARQTAIARLAALDAGDAQPVIPAAPAKAANATSLPTPPLAAPILNAPVAQAPAAKQGRRVALVIGNSAYRRVPQLINPKNDAGAVALALSNVGFDKVLLGSNMTRETMVAALQTFAAEAASADWAMVYYAGHGIEVNGQNFIIPVEARLAADRDVRSEAVPIDQVMAALQGARKLKLVVLDACRDNPFTPQMQRTTTVADAVASPPVVGGASATRSIGRGLGEVKVSGASLVVFAAKHGQTALDGEGGNSPFAIALVQRMATPGVEINKIFRLVRDDVMEATAGRQEPFTYGSLPGREDFFFVAAR